MGNMGGARQGAGRKKGAATLKTREIADRETKSGAITPLEVMLDNMRFHHEKAAEILAAIVNGAPEDVAGKVDLYRELVASRERSQAAAQAAAPFMHPRLSTVHVTDLQAPSAVEIERDARSPYLSAIVGRFGAPKHNGSAH